MANTDELKEKVEETKINVAVATINTTSDTQVSLQEDMIKNAQATEFLLQNPQTYMEHKDKTAKELQEQLSNPVEKKTRNIDETFIGPFLGLLASTDNDREKYKFSRKYSKPNMERPEVTLYSAQSLSIASANGDVIEYPKFTLTEDFLKSLSDEQKASFSYLALTGNPFGELPVYFHELTHYEHENNGQLEIDCATAQTSLALNYTTEKVANATQWLAFANMYKFLKDSGVENLQHNGEIVPLDNIVEYCPGLKEIVTNPEFNLNDEKFVVDIVKVSSDYWDKEQFSKYCTAQFPHFCKESDATIIQQINAVKDGQKAMDDMLKERNIGYGMRIDIPKECAEFLQPSQKFLDKFVALHGDGLNVNNEKLLVLNAYLESIGLKNDKAKNEYLNQQYVNIINRTENADLKLQNLMVDCGINNSDKSIHYADGLVVQNIDGIKTVSKGFGADKYPITIAFDERLDNAQKQQTKDTTIQNIETSAFRPINCEVSR